MATVPLRMEEQEVGELLTLVLEAQAWMVALAQWGLHVPDTLEVVEELLLPVVLVVLSVLVLLVPGA